MRRIAESAEDSDNFNLSSRESRVRRVKLWDESVRNHYKPECQLSDSDRAFRLPVPGQLPGLEVKGPGVRLGFGSSLVVMVPERDFKLRCLSLSKLPGP